MLGSKCALEYCDYYDPDKQECARAIVEKMKVEILEARLKVLREKIAKEEKLKKSKEYMAKCNIVVANKTLQ